MEINFTLIVQMCVFIFFAWFTMRFIWPPLSKAMEERQGKIADGLAAAERGHKELELAQQRVKNELKQAKMQAAEIIDKANRRSVVLISEAKESAKLVLKQQTELAQEQLQQAINAAREQLSKEVAQLTMAAVQKILMREVDEKAHNAMWDNLLEEI